MLVICSEFSMYLKAAFVYVFLLHVLASGSPLFHFTTNDYFHLSFATTYDVCTSNDVARRIFSRARYEICPNRMWLTYVRVIRVDLGTENILICHVI